jgi:hypothetical protein
VTSRERAEKVVRALWGDHATSTCVWTDEHLRSLISAAIESAVQEARREALEEAAREILCREPPLETCCDICRCVLAIRARGEAIHLRMGEKEE